MEYFDPINTRLDQILNKLSTIVTILEKQNSKAITTSSGYDTSYRVASNFNLKTMTNPTVSGYDSGSMLPSYATLATAINPYEINNDTSIATTYSYYPSYPNDKL